MAAIFTFKKGPQPTGIGSIASPNADIDIKRGGRVVGMIAGPSRFGVDHWQVRFVVKQEPTEDNPCGWKWIFLKQRNETEAEARQFVKDNSAAIVSRYDLADLDQ